MRKLMYYNKIKEILEKTKVLEKMTSYFTTNY